MDLKILHNASNILDNYVYRHMDVARVLTREVYNKPKMFAPSRDNADAIIFPDFVSVNEPCWEKMQVVSGSASNKYSHFFEKRNMLADATFNQSDTIQAIIFNSKVKNTLVYNMNYIASPEDINHLFPVYIEIPPYCNVELNEAFYNDAKIKIYRIVYVLREGSTLNISRSIAAGNEEQCMQIIESDVIQHPGSTFNITAINNEQHYLQDLYHVKAYKDTTTTITGRYNATADNAVHVITDIDHIGTNCTSNVNVKSVTDDISKFTFSGNLTVRKEAEGADAHLQNKNLQVVDTTTVITEPKLDISTKEIACTHGCTVSSIDEDQRYLLNTRGIDNITAKQLLIEAFLNG